MFSIAPSKTKYGSNLVVDGYRFKNNCNIMFVWKPVCNQHYVCVESACKCRLLSNLQVTDFIKSKNKRNLISKNRTFFKNFDNERFQQMKKLKKN